MSDRKIIRVSEESEATIREYAESKGIQVGEAADALITTAASRLAALKRYASNKQPMAPGKPKKKDKAAPKKKAKAGAKKKAAKRTAAAASEANGAATAAPAEASAEA